MKNQNKPTEKDQNTRNLMENNGNKKNTKDKDWYPCPI